MLHVGPESELQYVYSSYANVRLIENVQERQISGLKSHPPPMIL